MTARPCGTFTSTASFLTHGNELAAEGIVVGIHTRCDQTLAELLGANGLAVDSEAVTNGLPSSGDGGMLGFGLFDKPRSSRRGVVRPRNFGLYVSQFSLQSD